MFITDPETTTTDTTTPDPAAAAAEAPTPDAPEPDAADGMLAALAETGAIAQAEPAPEPKPGPAAELPPGAEPPVDAKPEPDKVVEDEIAGLKLKDKAAERFRDLTGQIKELAPVRDALKAAGIEDIAKLPQLVADAKDGVDLRTMVTDTGASAEQFGMTLDYLGLISAASKGDRAAAEKAWEMWQGEGKALAAALGKEMPGIYDPLAAHADLQAQVESGDMKRAAALEVAQSRQLTAAQQANAQRTAEQTQAAAKQQQAITQGVQSLQAWEATKLADPAYAALRPALNAKVAEIRQQFAPSQWATVTEMAYQALVAQRPVAPAAPAKPAPGPVRPTGPRPAMMPTTDDPVEAMWQGIQAATP